MATIINDQNDPWAGWAIDPNDAQDLEIGQTCIVRMQHDNGTWWLSVLGTVTERIGDEWGFKVKCVLDGDTEAVLSFDVPKTNTGDQSV